MQSCRRDHAHEASVALCDLFTPAQAGTWAWAFNDHRLSGIWVRLCLLPAYPAHSCRPMRLTDPSTAPATAAPTGCPGRPALWS